MGFVNISYLGIFLVFASGWLIVGWPTFLFTKYTHGDISYRSTLIMSIVGVCIGICLVGIALRLPVFVTIFVAISGSFAFLFGAIVGLRRNKKDH